MKDILSEIIAHKRIEIELQKQAVSLEKLQEEVAAMMQKDATTGTSVTIPVRSMKQALASSPTGIIAEFKRRSPSKGWIHETARAEEIPAAYETVGASAVSILTDEKFFGGSLQDIRMAAPTCTALAPASIISMAAAPLSTPPIPMTSTPIANR